MADRTITVGSGKDQANLQAAINLLSGLNLDSDNGTGGPGIVTIECYNLTGGAEDTNVVSVSGFTAPSGDNYLRIIGAASEKTSSNSGKWATDRYRLHCANNTNVSLNVAVAGTVIRDLQILNSVNGNNTSAAYSMYLNADQILVDRCIFACTTGASGNTQNYTGIATGASHGSSVIQNCLFYDFYKSGETKGHCVYTANGTLNMYNCTGYNAYRTFYKVGGTFNATNCGAAVFDNAGFMNMTSNTNYSEATPTFVNEGAKDFHLDVTDTTWRGQGSDQSGMFTVDIDGQTRPTGAGTWDIGCDQYVAVSAIPPGSLYVTLTL